MLRLPDSNSASSNTYKTSQQFQIVSNYSKPKNCTGKFYFIFLKYKTEVKFDGFSTN